MFNNNSLNPGLVGTTQDNSPVRETELSKATGRLRAVTEQLENSLLDLQARLGGVLAPVPPQNTDKAATPEFSTLLGKELSIIIVKIDSAVEFISQLQNRLEL